MPGKSKRTTAGFTILELMIAVALFVVLVIVLINIYLLTLHSQRQTAARQAVLNSVRYVMETISRQVRISEIDYGYAYNNDAEPGIDGSENELALIDPDGNRIVYYLENSQLLADVGGIQYGLTSADAIEVINLDFFIDPVTNPFTEERCNGALPPTGCLTGVSCNLSDSQAGYSGFCSCSQPSDCASGFCSGGLCLPFNAQPRVTIVLDFQAKQLKPEERKAVFLQTTVSSRVYKR